jgi:excisionase family DNA binding protein
MDKNIIEIGNRRSTTHLPKLSYTLAETANVTGLSERTIRRLIARGLLHKSKATRRIVISHKDIEEFLIETSA